VKRSIERLHRTPTKDVVSAVLLVGVLALPLSTLIHAAPAAPKDAVGSPGDTFSILLQGTYRPVVHGPNLGLSQVNLSDGSFSTVKIYPISGLPEEEKGHGKHANRSGDRDTDDPIGNFYVQFAGSLVAYDLPGGALTMTFTGKNVQQVPDGEGGTYIVGTFDLSILEATGAYRPFAGGHNRMVDILHHLPDGSFVEHCICIIRRT
jgi:hypothetical protein